MTKEFTIDKVAWHTQRLGNTEGRDRILDRFYAIVDFLQRNRLTVIELLASRSEISDDFSIRSSDLTEEGLELMRAVYDRWLRSVDRGADPSDVSAFEKTLSRLRVNGNSKV